MEPLVLTFDVGTQSTRALLAKKDGTFLDKEQFVYEQPYISEHPFWAEQKPFFYFDIICDVSKKLLSRNKEVINDIICVTVTTIRDTVICLDKDNQPLTNYILWLDKRGAKYDPKKVSFFKKIILKMVGMLETIEEQTKESTCNWIMQNEKEIWDKTKTYTMLSGHLNYLLTDILVDSIGSIIGHVPFNYKTGKWMNKSELTRCVYDVPLEKCCKTLDPGQQSGRISKKASERTMIPEGIPVISTGSDKGCESIGLSITDLGKASISFGTSSTIQITSKRYIEPQPFMPAYPAALPHMYNPEIQIYRGYWMLTWFIKEFCAEESKAAKEEGISTERYLNRKLESIPEGCDGLIIHPYWTAGVATPLARGSMIGFNDRQSKYHIYRAIIEGINFELYGALKQLEKRSGRKIEEVFIGGGGAKSREIMQITADMFGLPVKRIQTHEASGLGSSIVGFVSMNVFNSYDEAIKAMVHEKDVYYPNKEKHEFYDNLYKNTYAKTYKKLETIYAKERAIFKGGK